MKEMNNMTREDMKSYLLPELDLLQREENKEKVLDIWMDAVTQTGWQTKGLEHSLISTVMKNGCPENLMTHTRHVTAACAALYDAMGPMFDAVGKCDREDLLAGALIHDVGKLMEMDYVDGKAVYTCYGTLFTHPVSGAYLAQKYGMNQTVVHMVLVHSNTLSPQGEKAAQTPESLLLKYIDEMCYKYVELHWHV